MGGTRWSGLHRPLTVTMSACCSMISTATCLRPRMPKNTGARMTGHATLSAKSCVECTGRVGEARGGRCETKVHEALQFAKEVRVTWFVRARTRNRGAITETFNYEARFCDPHNFLHGRRARRAYATRARI